LFQPFSIDFSLAISVVGDITNLPIVLIYLLFCNFGKEGAFMAVISIYGRVLVLVEYLGNPTMIRY
jgi:hypothetical protein